jgi:hypothetical protein
MTTSRPLLALVELQSREQMGVYFFDSLDLVLFMPGDRGEDSKTHLLKQVTIMAIAAASQSLSPLSWGNDVITSGDFGMPGYYCAGAPGRYRPEKIPRVSQPYKKRNRKHGRRK